MQNTLQNGIEGRRKIKDCSVPRFVFSFLPVLQYFLSLTLSVSMIFSVYD